MKVYILLALVAAGLTALLTPLVRWVCHRWGILPALRERDIQCVPLPRLGGVAMTVAFLITVLIAWRIPFLAPLFQTSVPWALAGGAAAMSVVGVVDDLIDLDWQTKLSGQVLIVGLMGLGGVQLVNFPIFGLTIGSSRFSIILTVLVIVAIINAVNFIDGLDGLAAGVVGIGAGAFFIYSYLITVIMGAPSYATTASLVVVTLVGVCMGFLWFNYHPSSILMGGGAETLGLILAGAGVVVTGQIDPSLLGGQQILVGWLPIILPLSVITIPMGDLLTTAFIRLLKGRNPFRADRSHFHDNLLARGHSHRGVVAILWLWTAIVAFSAAGLLVARWQVVVAFAAVPFFIGVAATMWEFPRPNVTEDDPWQPTTSSRKDQ
ncbi:undecaprenyl/decaprenyl-phosphate alpha-N-acetylglucosaminyl 1-phosphate transferase [Schaalia sp. 19OD2882]|uniref:glycosyltransferase family 4 protein n=1 Tax=Schaalia sp. 19OD2882 TaxID=2794089 RepID=UPI001C1EA5CD|nr:MraY family glycosyltransferase [Schaalia sp. 19OD2882]QWW20356.1 undecaprenyl/decaprenyl-phosphate alpha-N-acetylglucosaminyl 1-phosphate transferase [Schaalia sp. 19OD2882]